MCLCPAWASHPQPVSSNLLLVVVTDDGLRSSISMSGIDRNLVKQTFSAVQWQAVQKLSFVLMCSCCKLTRPCILDVVIFASTFILLCMSNIDNRTQHWTILFIFQGLFRGNVEQTGPYSADYVLEKYSRVFIMVLRDAHRYRNKLSYIIQNHTSTAMQTLCCLDENNTASFEPHFPIQWTRILLQLAVVFCGTNSSFGEWRVVKEDTSKRLHYLFRIRNVSFDREEFRQAQIKKMNFCHEKSFPTIKFFALLRWDVTSSWRNPNVFKFVWLGCWKHIIERTREMFFY